MTSSYSATITVDAQESTRAIFESVGTDNSFYPENPVRTEISMDGSTLTVSVETDQLAHLRANLNSTLRLIRTSHESIESVR